MAMQAVKFSDIATFLGRSPNQPGDHQIGGDFSIRIHGTRVRHYLGPASIKMYGKHGFVLRVETTTNDVTFFRHHRMVEQGDGKRVMKLGYLKKDSLPNPRKPSVCDSRGKTSANRMLASPPGTLCG